MYVVVFPAIVCSVYIFKAAAVAFAATKSSIHVRARAALITDVTNCRFRFPLCVCVVFFLFLSPSLLSSLLPRSSLTALHCSCSMETGEPKQCYRRRRRCVSLCFKEFSRRPPGPHTEEMALYRYRHRAHAARRPHFLTGGSEINVVCSLLMRACVGLFETFAPAGG